MHPKDIKIDDYTYVLPPKKIAYYPLDERDHAKLLIWKSGNIKDDLYCNIANHLSPNDLVVFNNTKVIQARLFFILDNRTKIELFCLEPAGSYRNFNAALQSTSPVLWNCLIGKADKWKTKFLEKNIHIDDKNVVLKAQITDKLPDSFVIQFSWNDHDVPFSKILENGADVPLPPYIKRAAEPGDIIRYQTVFANHKGSVAAPTAGLHFTTAVIHALHKKNIATQFVTLHVGAGTFKPVKSQYMGGHNMHAEWINVSKQTIENILEHPENIIPVGTTSLRTIESLYWMGAKAFLDPSISENNIPITQWEVYDNKDFSKVNVIDALKALIIWLHKNEKEELISQTKIIIAPGYKFRLAKALVTNFHQPNSTLLLIIAAATSGWRKIYDHALDNNYRFLSYGDGCLIFFE